jgi:hypothetical protein
MSRFPKSPNAVTGSCTMRETVLLIRVKKVKKNFGEWVLPCKKVKKNFGEWVLPCKKSKNIFGEWVLPASTFLKPGIHLLAKPID